MTENKAFETLFIISFCLFFAFGGGYVVIAIGLIMALIGAFVSHSLILMVAGIVLVAVSSLLYIWLYFYRRDSVRRQEAYMLEREEFNSSHSNEKNA